MSTVQITNRQTGESFIVSRRALATAAKSIPRSQYERIKPNLRIVIVAEQMAIDNVDEAIGLLLNMDPEAAGATSKPPAMKQQPPNIDTSSLISIPPELLDTIISHTKSQLQAITITKTLMGYKNVYRKRQVVLFNGLQVLDQLGPAPNLDAITNPSQRSKYIELYLTGKAIPPEVATWSSAQFWSSPYLYQWANPPASVESVSERTFMLIALRGYQPTWKSFEENRRMFPNILEDTIILANLEPVLRAEPDTMYLVAWELLKESRQIEAEARERSKMDTDHEENWAHFLESEFPHIYDTYVHAQRIKARAIELKKVVDPLLKFIENNIIPSYSTATGDVAQALFRAFANRADIDQLRNVRTSLIQQAGDARKLPDEIIDAVDLKHDVEVAATKLAKLETIIDQANKVKRGLDKYLAATNEEATTE